MSMSELDKVNLRSLEVTKRKNDREVKALNNAFEAHKADIKKVNQDEIIDIRHEHMKNISEEADRKQNILAKMKNQLDMAKSHTDRELRNIADHEQKKTIDLQQKNMTERERLNAENELYLDDLNYRFNQASRNITSEGRAQNELTKERMHKEALELSKHYQQKIQQQTQEFNTRYTTDQLKQNKMKEQQDESFKRERMATNGRQQHELIKMTTGHMDQIDKRDKHFREGMKEQDLFFEKKFTTQLTRHNTDFKTLEDKNKKVVEDLKTSLTKEITTIANKQDDPFYKFEAMRPELRTFEDHVEISVKVPEHSKHNIMLTINGKDAIVNFSRRFADASREVDGRINKVNKVETYSTRVPTGHILDARTLKSTFEDGIMTYSIKKV